MQPPPGTAVALICAPWRCATARHSASPAPTPSNSVSRCRRWNTPNKLPARAGSLFGVFQRLHRETEFDGVGAGLALCRAVAQRHGAQISATAVPGGGCTVRVCWPG